MKEIFFIIASKFFRGKVLIQTYQNQMTNTVTHKLSQISTQNPQIPRKSASLHIHMVPGTEFRSSGLHGAALFPTGPSQQPHYTVYPLMLHVKPI